jgi:hypothetical protein
VGVANGMMAYASRTGTLANLKALGRAGWRLIIEPSQLSRYGKKKPDLGYAIDNGAWGCFQREVPFDEAAFLKVLERYGDDADWVVVPDIVAGGLESLRFSEKWLSRLTNLKQPKLLAVQDGMVPADVRSIVGKDIGIFVGGSTDWKLDTLPDWGALAREVGAHAHCARVNSVRRIRLCQHARMDSFDGTSVTMYSVNINKLDNARRQQYLLDWRQG